jgi:hypothetical protein
MDEKNLFDSYEQPDQTCFGEMMEHFPEGEQLNCHSEI